MKIFSYNCIRLLTIGLFIIYILYLVYLTLFAYNYGRGNINRSLNIIPFKTIVYFLSANLSYKIKIINIIGNIAAFVPMGVLLPIIKNNIGIKKIVIIGLIGTVSIEVIQYITGVGASDVDDVILNVLGTVFGYLIYYLTAQIIGKIKPKEIDD